MKHEMRWWDARRRLERRARMFAAGLVLVLAGLMWIGAALPTVSAYGAATLLAGMGLVGAAARR